MLVDPKFKEWSEDQISESIKVIKSASPAMTEEETKQFVHDWACPQRAPGYPVGVFVSWRLEHRITGIKGSAYETIPGITRRMKDDHSSEWFIERAGHDIWEMPPYGVSDDVEQILARFSITEIPDRKFCIGISPIYKKDQPTQGGWRWHKWGPYLGTHEITCEYLHDEEGIEGVLLYHIYEIE